MPKGGRARVERTRTFTGCRTCRHRHTKCDETRPSCMPCRQAGLTCGGYAPQLLWESDVAGQKLADRDKDVTKARFPFSSDGERESSSKLLHKSLDSQPAEEVLLNLDTALRKARRSEALSVHMGPFGAFQFPPTKDASLNKDSLPASSSGEIMSKKQDEAGAEVDDCTRPDEEWVSHLDHIDLDTLDMSVDLDMYRDVQTVTENDAALGLDLAIDDYSSLASDTWKGFDLPPTTTQDIPAEERGMYGKDVLVALSRTSPSPGDLCDSDLLEEAPLLLRYYKKHIDTSSAAINAKRISPWQLVFLPCAFQTLGELTSLGKASNVRKAILFAILSKSALHFCRTLSNARDIQHWRDVGIRYGEKARHCLQEVLKLSEETDYEDLLMAFLAMALALLYQGSRAPRCLLLDAEKLIRFRGKTAFRGQRTRILHHLYTYLRVLYESISSIEQSFNGGSGMLALVDGSEATTFRISEDALNMGLDPSFEKTEDIGYGDLHLEVQGRWAETLHSTIHGVPESLMTLLAQTTSLANELTYLETHDLSDARLTRNIKRHTKTLEKRIWSWCLDLELNSTAHDGGATNGGSMTMQDLLEHPQTQAMVRAVHQAVIIYFYRRIYDVSPRVLQDNVLEALDRLESCMEQIVADDDFTPSLAWATFITASEATSPEIRSRALKCVDVIDHVGFHYTTKPLREVILSVWEEQQQ